MASKTIMIQEDTYNKLLKLKKNNESFNDVIRKLIDKEQNLDEYFGIFTDEEGDLILKSIEEAQKENELADNERSEILDDVS